MSKIIKMKIGFFSKKQAEQKIGFNDIKIPTVKTKKKKPRSSHLKKK